MKESPSRIEVYCVMAIAALLILFAQHAYYLAAERLTVKIEAAVREMPRQQQQQQSVINEFPPTREQMREDTIRRQLERERSDGLRGTSAGDSGAGH